MQCCDNAMPHAKAQELMATKKKPDEVYYWSYTAQAGATEVQYPECIQEKLRAAASTIPMPLVEFQRWNRDAVLDVSSETEIQFWEHKNQRRLTDPQSAPTIQQQRSPTPPPPHAQHHTPPSPWDSIIASPSSQWAGRGQQGGAREQGRM